MDEKILNIGKFLEMIILIMDNIRKRLNAILVQLS